MYNWSSSGNPTLGPGLGYPSSVPTVEALNYSNASGTPVDGQHYLYYPYIQNCQVPGDMTPSGHSGMISHQPQPQYGQQDRRVLDWIEEEIETEGEGEIEQEGDSQVGSGAVVEGAPNPK